MFLLAQSFIETSNQIAQSQQINIRAMCIEMFLEDYFADLKQVFGHCSVDIYLFKVSKITLEQCSKEQTMYSLYGNIRDRIRPYFNIYVSKNVALLLSC